MRLLIRNHLKNAVDSLGSNRMRSLLTVVGIAIGVASIVVILSLSGGVQRLIGEQIESAGGNIMVVRPESNRQVNDKNVFSKLTTTQTYAGSSLTEKDVESISKIEAVTHVAPLSVIEMNLKADNEVSAVSIVATNSSLNDILQLPIKDGQFFDSSFTGKTVVIGHDLALNLYDTTSVIGKTLRIKDVTFMIVGVIERMEKPINYNNVDFDNAAIIDISHVGDLDINSQIQQINIKTINIDSLDKASQEVQEKLLENHQGEPDFVVSFGSNINHPTEDLLDVVSSILTLVAGISLVVGGIGVMNIMLVSVAERTHEIGIKKAVGATNFHILLQFLFEALILGILGGLIGFGFGYAFSFGISIFTPFRPVMTEEIVMISSIISVAIGCIFGIYPALKASRKNPIDSLRHYR
jgi:ABC-type transport system, involved in lipoprotein release, permease component